jgi:hypothetical protein
MALRSGGWFSRGMGRLAGLVTQSAPSPSDGTHRTLRKGRGDCAGLYSFKYYARPHVVWDEPIMRLTAMAAMPASTALAIGDDSMSPIGFDPDACS